MKTDRKKELTEKLTKIVEQQPKKRIVLPDGSRFEIVDKHAGLLFFTSWNYMYDVEKHFTEDEIKELLYMCNSKLSSNL